MTDENNDYQKDREGQPLALEKRKRSEDGRRFSPSTGRNKDVVRETYQAHMPRSGTVLEIASGTGEHGAHIVAALSDLTWVYSDIDPASQASQHAWRTASDHDRLRGPLTIDTSLPVWTETDALSPLDGMFCANMIHIAPIAAAEGLFAGAGHILRTNGRLMIYGPFARQGEIAPSNARFSDDLQRRDPRWGVRDLDQQIFPLAARADLRAVEVIEMPANNLSVIFEKA